MAKKTTKANEPVTGLGETMKQITETCSGLAKDLLALVKKGGKAPVNDLLEAAYRYGVAERRRRKLARKVKNGSEE